MLSPHGRPIAVEIANDTEDGETGNQTAGGLKRKKDPKKKKDELDATLAAIRAQWQESTVGESAKKKHKQQKEKKKKKKKKKKKSSSSSSDSYPLKLPIHSSGHSPPPQLDRHE